MFTYKENNGNQEVYYENTYIGLISQNPDDKSVMNPGMWRFCFHNKEGGLTLTGPEENTKTLEEAKIAFEQALCQAIRSSIPAESCVSYDDRQRSSLAEHSAPRIHNF
jgi:hypothetical protein